MPRGGTALRSHDIASLNMSMLDILQEHCGGKKIIDPATIPAALLEEAFFTNQIKATSIESPIEEFEICDNFDATLAISQTDQEELSAGLKRSSTFYIPPTIEPASHKCLYDAGPLMVLSDYLPNVQGYAYFVTKVLPRILQSLPNFCLQVVGNACQRLVPSTGINLVGIVDDLTSLYRQCRFAVCPVLGGTGMQIKVVEAMAHCLPVVILENLARSTVVQHGVNGYIAANAEQFSEYCIELESNPSRCRELGQAARETIEQKLSLARSAERWSNMYRQIACPNSLTRPAGAAP